MNVNTRRERELRAFLGRWAGEVLNDDEVLVVQLSLRGKTDQAQNHVEIRYPDCEGLREIEQYKA